MSSLIEQAAQRLEQLRQAGVVVDDPVPMARPGLEAIGKPPTKVSAVDNDPPQARSAQISKSVELNLAAIAAAGIVTPNAPRTRIADQYRVIKRPLISNAMGQGAATTKNGNLIMVTSALAGEGKSFSAINLAMSIAAEMDHTVMLVDADVARPSIPRMLGFKAGPGLLDVLDGSTDMSSVMLRTNVDKLTLLPSGSQHHRATELLASDAMRQLLNEIATRYPDRIVIFDSPPLLLTTESRVLATHMGQVVMVVQADKTLQADVQHALSTIETCPVRLMLLNQARVDAKGAYAYGYGYSYGQGYGHGYGYEQEPQQVGSA